MKKLISALLILAMALTFGTVSAIAYDGDVDAVAISEDIVLLEGGEEACEDCDCDDGITREDVSDFLAWLRGILEGIGDFFGGAWSWFTGVWNRGLIQWFLRIVGLIVEYDFSLWFRVALR